MAPLPDLQTIIFKSGIDTLRTALRVATKALIDETQQIDELISAYLASGVLDGERDEDGVVLWDREDQLGWEKDVIEDALMALRKSFALAAFHHWERSARQWTSYDKMDNEGLFLRLRQKSITVHPRLQAVRDLVNTLKHDNASRGRQLLVSWPQVFPKKFTERPGKRTPWYEAIYLDDALVEEVFAIVAASGPDPAV